jgi:hypothetical protein
MTATTNSQSNSNGVYCFATGKIVQDATTAAALTLTLGFVPRYFRLVNLTDRITDEWFDGMAAASSLHTVAAGTLTLETTNGITVSGTSVTFTATTMVASKTYYWEAAA